MVENTKTKIGFSSRYYEPLNLLKSHVNARRVMKHIYNSDRDTSFPAYLYDDYKNEIDPVSASAHIINSIRKFLDAELFNIEERKLLLAELAPSIEHFGQDVIHTLTHKMEITENKERYSELYSEYKKTIESLKETNKLLNKEFSTYNFMSTSTSTPEAPIVFVSYSHDNEEHKDWVLQLATRLRSNGVNVMLDRWNTRLGSDLPSFMEKGLSQSHRVICVCSETYVRKANDGKGGAGYEKHIMTAELVGDQNTDWIIPLIKNNPGTKKTPTFLGGRKYISFEDALLYETNYEELLRDLLNEPVLPIPPLGKNPFQTIKEFAQQKFIPASEKYVSPATSGKVTFDYSDNDGQYAIGQGELMFETNWSGSGDTSIHLYDDPSNIKAIALVKDTDEIKKIKDARVYDTSSRARTVHLNQIAVLQNNNGFYAAVKVLAIKIDHDGKGTHELTFEYFIQTNGSPDFTI